MPVLNMITALNSAMKQAFARDQRLVAFGEDVGAFGGVFRVTSGLQQLVGEARCFNTPLAEGGIVGFAIGLAQYGLKPVCEIQFADYIFPAYDQIVNEMAKMRYRTGGSYTANVVIRTPYGGGIKGGLYHSQSPEAQFLHTPGLTVVVPASPYEAKGLLLSALASNDPVLFMEPKRIYRILKEEVPEEEYLVPLGQAHVARIGSRLTLIGWGAQHQENLVVADRLAALGIDAEVINLRTLSPLDRKTLILSVNKTGRCLICHEAPQSCGFGAELAAILQESCFLRLEAPIMRCCGLDTPFPHTLEELYMPTVNRVVAAAQRLMRYPDPN